VRRSAERPARALRLDHALDGKRLGDVTRGRGLEPTIENGRGDGAVDLREGRCAASSMRSTRDDFAAHPAPSGDDDRIGRRDSDLSRRQPASAQLRHLRRACSAASARAEVITSQDAVRKMSRSRRSGSASPIAAVLREGIRPISRIFDSGHRSDTATFERPHQFFYAEGVQVVIVKRQVAYEMAR